jgi:hypothetical protein
MKTTRILLAFAAALSLGLAVFASVRTHISAPTATSIQSSANVADDLSGDGSDSDHMV